MQHNYFHYILYYIESASVGKELRPSVLNQWVVTSCWRIGEYTEIKLVCVYFYVWLRHAKYVINAKCRGIF